jgi:hypothetical protein
MSSNLTTEQETIKHCYEVLGAEPSIIAEDRGLDVMAVKACLMSISGKYRKDCGVEEKEEPGRSKLNFTEEEGLDFKQIIIDTARFADDPHLRFKAATYGRDDMMGRKDVVKNVGNVTFNLLEFNSSLQKMKQVKQQMMERLGAPVNV